TGRDTSWNAMLGEGERDATEEEIAALEAENGPLLPADGEGWTGFVCGPRLHPAPCDHESRSLV
ncbi:MAG: hypothetical protein ACM3N0_12120, partial [Chloroflexota bacterium]